MGTRFKRDCERNVPLPSSGLEICLAVLDELLKEPSRDRDATELLITPLLLDKLHDDLYLTSALNCCKEANHIVTGLR